MGILNHLVNVCHKMHRKRKLVEDNLDTKLKRCLSSWELAFIGLSTMLSGVFIITTTVIHDLAGPGIVVSYLLAGVAAVLSALAYAEIGSRVPCTGSSFVYAAITLGEIWGFLAGWNMILEYTLTAAAMARTFTSTMDLMLGGTNVSDSLNNVSFEVLGQKTDVIATGIVAVFASIVGLGVRLTSFINIGFNVVSMLLVFIVSALSFGYGNPSNWFEYGSKTFFPNGADGVIAGAAACYFAYIGFEVITITGEESVDPHKSVPLGILIAFIMAIALYIVSSLGLTYFTSAVNFISDAPLAEIFYEKGFYAYGITLNIAGLLSVCTNVIVALYATPRVFYAMACDGLMFKWMGVVNGTTQTPLYSMLVSGILVCFITFFFDLATLVMMVSIGTLSSYILVTIGTVLLRYQPYYASNIVVKPSPLNSNDHDTTQHCGLVSSDTDAILSENSKPGERKQWVTNNRFFETVWPDVRPETAVFLLTFCIILLAMAETVAMKTDMFFIRWNIVLVMFLLLPIGFWMVHLLLYEQNVKDGKTFRMPLMPLIPVLSIWMNIQFMFVLPWETWVRLIVWVAIGLVIYFSYGIRHSQNTEDGLLVNGTGIVHTTYGTSSDVTPPSDVIPSDKVTSASDVMPTGDVTHAGNVTSLGDVTGSDDVIASDPTS